MRTQQKNTYEEGRTSLSKYCNTTTLDGSTEGKKCLSKLLTYVLHREEKLEEYRRRGMKWVKKKEKRKT
jgi:hypothetical protein